MHALLNPKAYFHVLNVNFTPWNGMHFDNVSVLLNSVAALLSVLIIGLAYMKKVFQKYLDIYSRGKSDKNGIFDVVTSNSIFDEYIFFE